VTARYLTNGAAIEAPERAGLPEPGGWLALADAIFPSSSGTARLVLFRGPGECPQVLNGCPWGAMRAPWLRAGPPGR
jgi:hypothetical protein